MVELLIAVVIMLVVSAIAVPNVIQTTQIFRLNTATTSLQNTVEVAPFTAIRRNTQIELRRTTWNGQLRFSRPPVSASRRHAD